LKQENHALQMVVLNLRRELENKQGAVGRLELVLRERLTRIDDFNGKLEQARAQNQRLDAENEHLMDMVVEWMRLPPPQSPT
jgi:hypothetical protein